jgi:polar amino acid transport system substrate-binding protein
MKHTLMKRILLLAGVLLALLVSALPQRASAQPAELRIAVKPLVPFVAKQGEELSGFSIDLWREIAIRNDWRYSYVWLETVSDVLDAVEKNNADVGIAGISMTPEREAKIDFSLSMFNAGLQIMTAQGGSTTLGSIINTVFTPDLLRVLFLILLAIIFVGHIIWLNERKDNPDFPKAYMAGVWEGVWQAGVSLATVGYGDRAPKTIAGRLGALLWMFIAIVLVAYFTGVVTSTLTVQQIQGSISGPTDLPGKRVVSVEGTTASKWLTERGINHTTVKQVEDAYPMLTEHSADALVFDAPVLLFAANESNGNLKVVGPIFKQEQYGIVVQGGSPLRETINRTLLEIYSDGTYQQLYSKWFGAANAQ